MGNITLTKILFASLIGVFMITTLYGAYTGFLSLNGGHIEAKYQAVFNNISNQQNSLTGIAESASDRGLVTNIYDAGKGLLTGTVNIFVTGLEAMGMFFNTVPIIKNILNAISFGVPELSGLIGLLITLTGLYIAMRYIQSVSNKQELP